MQDQPDCFDEFLRKIDPLMQSPSLFQSLDFACIAAKSGTDWILISGRAVLGVEPSEPKAKIENLVTLDEFVAISGRIRAVSVFNLIMNMRNGWVVDIGPNYLERIKLFPSSIGGISVVGLSWNGPVVQAIEKTPTLPSSWKRALIVDASGPDLTPLFNYKFWQEIDSQLRRNEVANGFDALSGRLALDARRTKLRTSFRFSAELPARFEKVQADAAKGTLELDIDCAGRPELMIDWLPRHDFLRVPQGWQHDAEGFRHHVSLGIPDKAQKAELILSFADLEPSDSMICELSIKNPAAASSASKRKQRIKEDNRWRRVENLPEGGQAHIFLVEDNLQEFSGQWVQKRLKNINDPTRRARFGQEIAATQRINHPNVLKIIDSDPTAEKPYFVTEYCKRGSLQRIGASSYKGDILATMQVIMPVLDALVEAHRAGVFHRDIKPPNILIREDGTPVIGDFGICFMEGGEPVTVSGEALGSVHRT